MPKPGYPTFMEKVNAVLAGSPHKGAFPMPDSEFGQEGPLMHLFISKILKEFNERRALEEHYGMPMEDFDSSGKFTRRYYDPEKDLNVGKKWKQYRDESGLPDEPNYAPVRPWDMREF